MSAAALAGIAPALTDSESTAAADATTSARLDGSQEFGESDLLFMPAVAVPRAEDDPDSVSSPARRATARHGTVRRDTIGRVLAAMAALVLFTGTSAAATARKSPAAAPVRPNIVLIVTDDEDWRVHEYMPLTRRLLHEQGATFSQYLVTYSLCCPSRASILRGQYPHNTGVLGNRPPSGGYARFVEMGDEASTVATWLQGGGYYTALVGKYLNGYDMATASHVPPGWSDWHAVFGVHRYFDYHLSENGRVVNRGHAAGDYEADVLSGLAVSVIRTAAARRQPLFLYLAPAAPHLPAEPAPRHANLFADAQLPEGAAFNEEDVSDKPAPVRERPPVTLRDKLRFETIYRNRLRSMQAVDEMVEAVIATLRETGQLQNTYVIYTSDNGWHMGEHRLPAGKNTPYEEDIRLPLVIRGPGIAPGTVISRLALNIDLAPTIAELAHVRAPPWVDGRSLAPLWKHPEPQEWRTCALVQRGPDSATQEDEGDEPGLPWGFHALRTEQYSYVDWASGDRELYDLLADPAELHNLAREADPALVEGLHDRVTELGKCKGEQCRRAEDRPLGRN